jgi:hypothetical protein
MKFETRNSKFETSSKLENTMSVAIVKFRTLNFEFASNFEFRVSNFLSPDVTPTHD